MKFVRMSLIVTLFTPLILITVYYTWKWTDNAQFAGKFFDDKVEIVRVIASKRWHDLSDNGIACTYAAVEFSEETATRLRREGPKALLGKGWLRGGQERWNVDWRQTPVEDGTENRPADPLYTCLEHLPDRDVVLIIHDLETEGSWYYRHGQIATFLSAETRIAATLRYGD